MIIRQANDGGSDGVYYFVVNWNLSTLGTSHFFLDSELKKKEPELDLKQFIKLRLT